MDGPGDYDEDHWIAKIAAAQDTPIALARGTYESFLERFPTAGRYWKWYAEHELKESGSGGKVERVLDRCLVGCPSIDLWKFYLDHKTTVKMQGLTAESDPAVVGEARAEVAEAYDFALSHMGLSIQGGPIFADYVKFVASAEVRGGGQGGGRCAGGGA